MSVVQEPIQEKNVVVAPRERRQAAELLHSLGGHPERLAVDDEQKRVGLPPELARVLATVVEVMSQGGTVTIGSLPDELTTTVAADQLGISRPTLMKLIRNGEIKSHKVGSHHRLKLDDVRAFKKSRLESQRQAFDALRELDDELDDL